jgi:hypothetical protein
MSAWAGSIAGCVPGMARTAIARPMHAIVI